VQYNPSLLALDYNHSAYAANDFIGFKSNYGNFNHSTANYSTYIDKINSGVGILFSGYYNNSFVQIASTNVKLAYNYQFKLFANSVLSLGGAFGSLNTKYSFTYGFPVPFDSVNRAQAWLGDIGFTFKTDRFRLAMGYQNLNLNSTGSNSDYMVNGYVEYRFGTPDKFQFKPRIMALKYTNHDISLMLQGQVGYLNTYFLGIGTSKRQYYSSDRMLTLNFEYILLQKIKFSYTLNTWKQDESNGGSSYLRYYHEIGIGVQFGDRNTKKAN
jgi:hypothetical protein